MTERRPSWYRGTVLLRLPLLAAVALGVIVLSGCDVSIPATTVTITTPGAGPTSQTADPGLSTSPASASPTQSGPAAPSLTPLSTPTPTPLPTPPSPTAAAWTSVWSQDDCSFALDAMTEDHTLDYQAGQSYQAQGNQGMATTYYSIASRWSTAISEISGICASPASYPAGYAELQMVEWWGEAYLSHSQDSPVSAWDQQWMQTYTQLTDLYFALPCSDQGGPAPSGPSNNCAWQQNRSQWPQDMEG